MFKSGNFDSASGICNSTTLPPAHHTDARPSFNNLPQNQPLMVHMATNTSMPLPYGASGSVGYFAGTYDIDTTWTAAEVADMQAALHNYTLAWYMFRIAELSGGTGPEPTPPLLLDGKSFSTTIWYKNVTSGAWVFHSVMTTSNTYPWLMVRCIAFD